MAYYKNQVSTIILGSATAPATLTNSYNDNQNIVDGKGFNIVTIYIEYTPALSTSTFSLQVEGGPDSSNFSPMVSLVDTDLIGDTSLYNNILNIPAGTGGTLIRLRFLMELADIKLRFSIKETTLSTFGTGRITITRHEQ